MKQSTTALLAGSAVLAATLAGQRYGPGPHNPRTTAWYATLKKPPFTPPGAAIGIAWGLLDVLLVTSGARLMAAPPSRTRNRAVAGWWGSVLGLASHSYFFFGRRDLPGAQGVTSWMVLTSIATVREAARIDPPSAWLGVPLIGWVSFASLLNGEIWRCNRG